MCFMSCIYSNFQLRQELSTERLEQGTSQWSRKSKCNLPAQQLCHYLLPQELEEGRICPSRSCCPMPGSLKQELNQQMVPGYGLPGVQAPTAPGRQHGSCGSQSIWHGSLHRAAGLRKQSGVHSNFSTPHTATKGSSSKITATESRQLLSCHTTQNFWLLQTCL